MSERLITAVIAKTPLGDPPLSFNLDFHAIPFRGAQPDLENHWVPMRNRGLPSVMAFVAQTAGRLDPWSVTPHYLQASAYETMGERAKAYGQLQDALALEPRNSASLGVLGDFEARGGNFAAARAFYRRALALNPLDVGLQQLARIGERRSAGG